jgi:hypothetical protein
MKQILALLMTAALLTGCAKTHSHVGGAADRDQNVLTGGPMTGTTIDDLPDAVRSALRRQVPRAEVADIDKTMRGEEEVYEISFSEPGRNPKMFITGLGKIVTNPELKR